MNLGESRYVTVLALSLLVLLLGGCPTTSGPNDVDASAHPLVIRYRLPSLGFEIKAIHQLRVCKPPEKVAAGSDAKEEPNFQVKTAFVASPRLSTAASPVFVFDPTTVPNFEDDQNITVEVYPSGALKSINATSEDKTGAIVGGLFKTAASIAKLVIGLGDAAALGADPPSPCHAHVLAKLAEADALSASLTSQNKKLAEIVAGPQSSKTGAEIEAYQAAIAALESELTRVRTKHLTLEKVHTIPPNELVRAISVAPTETDLKKWLTDDGYDDLGRRAQEKWIEGEWGPAPEQPILSAQLSFAAEGAPREIDGDLVERVDEIHLRRPVVTAFEICEGACRNADGKSTTTERYARGGVAIPQWGEVQSIDFGVGVFEKRTIELSLSEAGVVTKLGWASPSRVARGVDFMSTSAEGAASLADIVQYGAENAQIKALDTQISLLEKKVKLKKAQEEFNKAFSTSGADPVIDETAEDGSGS